MPYYNIERLCIREGFLEVQVFCPELNVFAGSVFELKYVNKDSLTELIKSNRIHSNEETHSGINDYIRETLLRKEVLEESYELKKQRIAEMEKVRVINED